MDVLVGLMGCGTVGAGVVELVRLRREKIARLTGRRPAIRRILVRDPAKPRSVPVDPSLFTMRAEDILDDPHIDIVIETIGGIEPARTYILAALRAGKHVVTANKDLMALYGTELLEAAAAAGADLMYEAAVGGAIPLIRPLKESLAADEITDIRGIVNGTTNYILSKMTDTGADLDTVLREAQALGYAEADPSSDVDGWDAARKLVILASLAFHAPVRLDEVQVQGIRSIAAADVAYAQELGCVIKLIACGSNRGGRLVLSVRPTLVPKDHPLAHVGDAYNALFVRGDAAGNLMFYGRGAGSLPTASAVLGDLIDVLRNMSLNASGFPHPVCLRRLPVAPEAAPPQRHYIRMTVVDRPGVFARIAGLFGQAEVSMATVLQKRVHDGRAEIVIVTHEVAQEQLRRAVDAAAALEAVDAVHNVLPLETEAAG
ncbi:MAG: homoserine dehydrogenase [Firmicutes bacterium]|nr:homoserine dehydrogenase [Bacillota bacterium]